MGSPMAADIIFEIFSPEKVDPGSKAFEKLKNAKLFDPKRSSVIGVLNDQMKGNFTVGMRDEESNTGRRI